MPTIKILTATVAFDVDIPNGCDWVGPLFSGFVELSATEKSPTLLPSVIVKDVKPLIAFLERGPDEFADALRSGRFEAEAVRACYELALGLINVPLLVRAVEMHVLDELARGRPVDPAFRGLETIEAVLRVNEAVNKRLGGIEFSITHAVKEHAAVVVLFRGMKQKMLLGFNAAHVPRGGLWEREGGRGFLDWYFGGFGRYDGSCGEFSGFFVFKDREKREPEHFTDPEMIYDCAVVGEGERSATRKFVGNSCDVLISSVMAKFDAVDAIIGFELRQHPHCDSPLPLSNILYVAAFFALKNLNYSK